MEKPTFFEKKYTIKSVDIDLNQHLKLPTLLGFLEDIASEHAQRLGFGYEKMVETGLFWILLRQRLIMNTWPQWHETITIKTWSRPVRGIYAIREYEIYHDETLLGACSTLWMVLDINSRRPQKVGKISQYFPPQHDKSLDFEANKLTLPQTLSHQKTITFVASDLDINEHVNNATYARCFLDALPIDVHRQYIISDYTVNFTHESFIDQCMDLYTNSPSIIDEKSANVIIYGYGKNHNGQDLFISKSQLQRFR